MGDQHTKWSRFVTLIESCINDTYHDTIELTPYEAQLWKKPTRVWEKYIDKEVLGDRVSDRYETFVKMKDKREKHAWKINETNRRTIFKVGDLVLIRTYCQSDAVQWTINKFCELYCGPYKIKQVLGDAMYILVDCGNEQKTRGKFNVRQLKAYYTKKDES